MVVFAFVRYASRSSSVAFSLNPGREGTVLDFVRYHVFRVSDKTMSGLRFMNLLAYTAVLFVSQSTYRVL